MVFATHPRSKAAPQVPDKSKFEDTISSGEMVGFRKSISEPKPHRRCLQAQI